MKSPVFLFSLPRSGSTLLQRVLMSHEDIASVAEPWLMLPFVYAFKKNGIATEYGHDVSYVAFEDFVSSLPDKGEGYYSALNDFSTSLYEQHCPDGEMYFLDKTPRYYFIIPEILQVFPDAKFIFLFRNPSDVMSSMMQTWSNGNIKHLYNFENDLTVGMKCLSEGYRLLKDRSYAIQYEQFVQNPEKYTKEICQYLELDYQQSMLSNFSQQDTKGKLGDPTGVNEYKVISNDSIDKWKNTFNTIIRKQVISSYMKGIDDDDFAVQSYDKKTILNDISNNRTVFLPLISDVIDYIYNRVVRFFKSDYK